MKWAKNDCRTLQIYIVMMAFVLIMLSIVIWQLFRLERQMASLRGELKQLEQKLLAQLNGSTNGDDFFGTEKEKQMSPPPQFPKQNKCDNCNGNFSPQKYVRFSDEQFPSINGDCRRKMFLPRRRTPAPSTRNTKEVWLERKLHI